MTETRIAERDASADLAEMSASDGSSRNGNRSGLVAPPPTQGEIEMEALPEAENPMVRFRREWPLRKSNPEWISEWLAEQYIGESNAVASMVALLDAHRKDPENRAVELVQLVLRDERKHLAMIEELLISRGCQPVPPEMTVTLRRMDEALPGSAIASRAEAVRASEIRIVIADPDVPEDVRNAFLVILNDETFHERAFRRLAGEEVMAENPGCDSWCHKCRIDSLLGSDVVAEKTQ